MFSNCICVCVSVGMRVFISLCGPILFQHLSCEDILSLFSQLQRASSRLRLGFRVRVRVRYIAVIVNVRGLGMHYVSLQV